MNQYMTSLLNIIGATVSVKLTTGESFVGEIFCYETSSTNTIILKEQTDAYQASFRIIKIPQIIQVTAIVAPQPNTMASFSFPTCSKTLLEQRERVGISQFIEKRHALGVNVSQNAQEIFDFIHKTHPDCCWVEGNRIKVMGVVVSPPYKSENCEGEGRALERIMQVLDRFNQRKKNAETCNSSGDSQRKGSTTCQDAVVASQGFSHGKRSGAEDGRSPMMPSLVETPAPVMFGRLPYGSNEEMVDSCGSSNPPYPGCKAESQPVMFLNPTPPALSIDGDTATMVPVHQAGNGLMFIVFQNPEDCIATVGQPVFVTAPNTFRVPELPPNCVPDQHPLNRVIAFPTFDTGHGMLFPALDGHTMVPTVPGATPEVSSTTFASSQESSAQTQRPLAPPHVLHNPLRLTSVNGASSQSVNLTGKGKCSWSTHISDSQEHSQQPSYTSKPTSKDVSNSSMHHPTTLLSHPPRHTPSINVNHGESIKNRDSVVENVSSSCVYHRPPTNGYDSTSGHLVGNANVITRSNSAPFSSNRLTLQMPSSQKQNSAAPTRSTTTVAPAPPSDPPVVSRMPPASSPQHSAQDSSKSLLSGPCTTTPQYPAAGGAALEPSGLGVAATNPTMTSTPSGSHLSATQPSRYPKLSPTGSSSVHEAPPTTARSCWNNSMRNQGNHGQGFMNGSTLKGQHQDNLRPATLCSGNQTSEGNLRGNLSNESSLHTSVGVPSTLFSDQHHVNPPSMHYNNGSHSNYRSMNGGKASRTHRNRGSNGRRRDQ